MLPEFPPEFSHLQNGAWVNTPSGVQCAHPLRTETPASTPLILPVIIPIALAPTTPSKPRLPPSPKTNIETEAPCIIWRDTVALPPMMHMGPFISLKVSELEAA